MTSYVTPKKNTAFIMYITGLPSVATPGTFQVNPTIAAGDVKVITDGGASANITTLPTVTPAGGTFVKISLSATEMNGDNVTVLFHDAAGGEWLDMGVNIQTSAYQIDDIGGKTSQLTFTNAGEVDSNAKSMNDAAILGNGTSGDLWRGS